MMLHNIKGLVVAALVVASLMGAHSTALADAHSREGCMNQWLFNGVWRAEVTAVEPHMNGAQQDGWQVTEVWRNGTSQQASPKDAQLLDQRLELGHGSIAASESTSGSLSMQSLAFNGFPPAGEFTYKQVFLQANVDPNNKPKGLLVTFDAGKLAQFKNNPQFTTSKYNFHFNLGCVATGRAAQAEGGSTQIAATEGCMNQWLSNGIWKMRVDSIAGNPADQPQKNWYGWRVTQTWVNVSGRGVMPGPLNDKGTAFLATHVTDEYLATQGGKNGSSSNVAGGLTLMAKPGYDWAPGASFTFGQLFGWGGFDANDKPIRLLVTFDTKTQNALPGYPHYRMPANFRISLTCSK